MLVASDIVQKAVKRMLAQKQTQARRPVTLEQYEFHSLVVGRGREVCALFTVEHSNGHCRDEILGFPVIEARIWLWEDMVKRDPGLGWRDRVGHNNHRQYVRALVEALKVYAV